MSVLKTKAALDAAGQPFPTRDYWAHIDKLLEYHRTEGREALEQVVAEEIDNVTQLDGDTLEAATNAVVTALVGDKT